MEDKIWEIISMVSDLAGLCLWSKQIQYSILVKPVLAISVALFQMVKACHFIDSGQMYKIIYMNFLITIVNIFATRLSCTHTA